MDSTMVGEDELKHYDEKESDGGEVSSPALNYHEGEEDESGKSGGSSSTHPTAPEGNHMEERVEEGVVQTERELKLEEDCKIENISIESTEEVCDRGSSSSSSSSSSSDDESHEENKTAVVETGSVVDLVKPVETLPEVVCQVTECVKVEDDSEVVKTDPVNQINQVNDSIPAQETDDGVSEAVQVIDLAEPSDCFSGVENKGLCGVVKTWMMLQTKGKAINVVEAYSAELKRVALKLLNLMAKALEMNPEEIGMLFEEGMQSMRMNYYPPCPQPDQVIGLAPHSDGDALTILLELNETQGLQVKKDGVWIPVKPLPSAFVVNIGDVMEIVTNGTYPSIEHRGVVNSEKERMSIATFLSPKLDGEFGPAQSRLSPETPPKFKRIGAADFLKGIFGQKLAGKSFLDTLRI